MFYVALARWTSFWRAGRWGFAVRRFPGARGAAVIEASITSGAHAAGSPAPGADGFVDPSLAWRSAAV